MPLLKKSAKIVTEEGYILCPVCREMKLLRLLPNGKVTGYLYCRHCKKERYLDIDLSLSQ